MSLTDIAELLLDPDTTNASAALSAAIDAGVNLDDVVHSMRFPSCGKALLHIASLMSTPAEFVQRLLDAGASPEVTDEQLVTPLHLASRNSSEPSVAKVHALLRHGATVNAQDCYGNSALHYACFRNYFASDTCDIAEIITALLDHGADPHLKNNNNDTPLSTAYRFNNLQAVDIMLKLVPSTSQSFTTMADKVMEDSPEDRIGLLSSMLRVGLYESAPKPSGTLTARMSADLQEAVRGLAMNAQRHEHA